MPLITNNIIVGADKVVIKGESSKPKKEPKLRNNSFLKTLEEIKKTAELKPKVEKPKKFIRKNKQVIIEKRAKLNGNKIDRKSAYVRDMTTV